MAKQVFYSFHYDNDNWRASQVRNIGLIEGNRPAPDNEWETIKKGGDKSIQKWIDDQMHYRSCTILLVGSSTADRKWIDYEIEKTWKEGMGLVGICIHNLKDRNGNQSTQGKNPFIGFSVKGTPLNQIVKLYNPPYSDSKLVYNLISENILKWADESVEIRKKY
ncbi:MAG: TIR domain-containing protein [Bacteroidota bacterium]